MSTGQWIPHGFEMQDGNHIRSIYVRGDLWQLYTTMEDGQALCITEDLHNRWVDLGYIEPGIFEELNVSEIDVPVYLLSGRSGYLMCSVKYGPFVHRRDEALGFIKSVVRSWERMGYFPLDDAIYIAQFSRVFPGNEKEKRENKAILLGHFLSGGVDVPITSVDVLRKYASYLNEKDIDQMLHLLGMSRDEETAAVVFPQTQEEQQVAAPQVIKRGERPNVPFELPGRANLEAFFREEILDIIDREEEYRRMGISFPGPTLFYGPPGSGKTFAVKKLTDYLGWPVFHIDSGSIGSKYIHETSKLISSIFEKAEQEAPSVVVMDELEAFLSDRSHAQASREAHFEETAEFLRRLQEAAEKRVLVFGMTNMRDEIDKAFLRHGRFDNQIEVGMISEEEVFSLLKSLFAERPVSEDVDLGALSRKLAQRPISDIAFVVREAGRRTVRAGKKEIDMETLLEAADKLHSENREKRTIGFRIDR